MNMDEKNIETPPNDFTLKPLTANDLEAQPAYAHLFNFHPDPKVAATIRELLLEPVYELLGAVVWVTVYCVFWTRSTAVLEEYQSFKFYFAAGVASIAVNVPLYMQLRRASVNPEFYHVGFGPSPGSPAAPTTEWGPRRITHSAKLRYILPLAMVAFLWLLPVGIFIYYDMHIFLSWLQETAAKSVTMPVWKKIPVHWMVGLGYVLHFMTPVFVAASFVLQTRICYNCVSERQRFFALDKTRDVLAVPVDEKAALGAFESYCDFPLETAETK